MTASTLVSVPTRPGPRPVVRGGRQIDQLSPSDVTARFLAAMRDLQIETGTSAFHDGIVSLRAAPHAHELPALRDEFAQLHPGGFVLIAADPDVFAPYAEKQWVELAPWISSPPGSIVAVLYAPRDDADLIIALELIEAAHSSTHTTGGQA